MQRSILGVVKIFMKTPWTGFEDAIQIDRINLIRKPDENDFTAGFEG
jgi:hypothetical protein